MPSASKAKATEAVPATQPGNMPKQTYGLFDIRSRVVQSYTHLIGKTQVKNVPTLVAWLACKNMEFLWWLKTDVQKCIHLLEMIAVKHGIEVDADTSNAPQGPASLPDFLGNGMKVTGKGTQAQRKAS